MARKRIMKTFKQFVNEVQAPMVQSSAQRLFRKKQKAKKLADKEKDNKERIKQ